MPNGAAALYGRTLSAIVTATRDAAPSRSTRRSRWRTRQIVGWRSTVPLAAALVLGFGLLYTIRITARPIALLIISIAIAEALEPLVQLLERKISRRLAVAAVYVVLLAIIGLVGWIILPVALSQTQEIMGHIPGMARRIQQWLERWNTSTALQTAGLATRLLATAGAWLLLLPARVITWLTYATLVLFLSAYWLVGSPSLLRSVLSLFPVDRRRAVGSILHDTGQAMGGYVRGAAINAAVMGLLAFVGLQVIGVEYALALGLVTMLAEPIPVVGPILAAVPVTAVALLQSPMTAVLALSLFIVLQQVEAQVLMPTIMRRQTDVPQTFVLLAVIAGGAVGGVVGVLAAIPFAAGARVLMIRAVVPALRRWTGADLAVSDQPVAPPNA